MIGGVNFAKDRRAIGPIMTTRKRLHEETFSDSDEESDAQETWEDARNGEEPVKKKVNSFIEILRSRTGRDTCEV